MGIKKAKSDLITNCNIDDRRNPKLLELYVKAMEQNPDIDLVYSGYYITYNPNETFQKNNYRWIVEPEEFSERNMCKYFPGPQPIWRKSMHNKNGFFNESFSYIGNWEMWLRAVSNGAKFKKIPGIHILYYYNPNGLSTSQDKEKIEKRNKETEQTIKKYEYLWNPNKVPPLKRKVKEDKFFVIVIASYNNKYWYQRNLDSIFFQTYKNYKILYVDDCSPDNTGSLVENYTKECGFQDKVILIKNKERKGCPLANHFYAINAFCKPTDIVICVDGDDWFSNENVLSYLNEVYQDPEDIQQPKVWATFGQLVHYPNGELYPGWEIPKEIIEKNTFREYNWITTHLKTFYAGLFQRIKKEDFHTTENFFQWQATWHLCFQ